MVHWYSTCASLSIYDFYRISRQIDPEPGESFVARWRLRVDESQPLVDPGLSFASDEAWAVGFEFRRIYNSERP